MFPRGHGHATPEERSQLREKDLESIVGREGVRDGVEEGLVPLLSRAQEESTRI